MDSPRRPDDLHRGRPAGGALREWLKIGWLLVGLMLPGALPAVAGTSNLTNNTLTEQAPKSNPAGQAVWSAWDGTDFEVYYWDGVSSSPVQVTTNAADDRYPQISPNGTVATWMRWDGTDWEILRKDVSNPVNPEVSVTTNSVDDFFPRVTLVSGTPRVVWLRPDTANPGLYQLYRRDGTNTESLIASRVVLDQDTEVYDPDLSDGGMIAWVGDVSGARHIFRWNGSTTTQLSSSITENRAPRINVNGTVVWQGWNGAASVPNWDIYRYDGTSTVALTTDVNDDILPQLNGNATPRVVWMRASRLGWEIYRKDGTGTEQRLTTNATDDYFPRVNSSGWICYRQDNGTPLADTYLWDGSTTLQVGSPTGDSGGDLDSMPQLDNSGRVLSLGWDGSDWEVFLSKATAVRSISFGATTFERGGTVTGTVTLVSAAPSGGATVLLYADTQGILSFPATVTVLAGATTATFQVKVDPGHTKTSTTGIRAVYSGDEQKAMLTVAAVRRICVLRPSTMEWLIREYDGALTTVQFGGANDQPVPGNYDGTDRDQIAVLRPSTYEWYIRKDDGAQTLAQWGGTGDQAAALDFFGWGRMQIAVFRPSTGEWFVRDDKGVSTTVVWGSGSTDQPLPRDYFRWGYAQLAYLRPSTFEWRIYEPTTYTQMLIQWGTTNDQCVPADYFGWGRNQIAVYRPSTGEFLIRDDFGIATTVTGSFQSADKPVPGDYLGTGRAQVAVYRPSTATWHIRADDGTILQIAWGAVNTDQAVPGKFSIR